MDPAHVANVLDRTRMPSKRHGLDTPAERQEKGKGYACLAGVEEKDDVDIQQSSWDRIGAGSPEQWIYPSGTAPLRGQGHRGPENDKDDEEGSAEGKEDKSYINDQGNPDGMQQHPPDADAVSRSLSLNSLGSQGHRRQIQTSLRNPPHTKAAEEGDAPAVLVGLREAAANNYPQTQPDPFNERAEEEEEDVSGLLSAASSVPRLPNLPQGAVSGQGQGQGQGIYPGDVGYVPANQTMSFDEFKEDPDQSYTAPMN